MLVPSRDGRTIAEDDLIAAITDEVALLLLPSVLYRSGQLLDIPRLTAAAHAAGALIGFDCAHSVGALPHQLDEWDVDFAVWCTYKYLNAGPGAVGALYVNPRTLRHAPALAGWWGYRKDRQFEMAHALGRRAQRRRVPGQHGAALRGGNAARLAGDLRGGRDRGDPREITRADRLPDGAGRRARAVRGAVRTTGSAPRVEHDRRGGHVAIEHDAAARISMALKARGVIVDFRPPDVVRLAPVALYTTYRELWQAAQALREIIDSGAYRQIEATGLVT